METLESCKFFTEILETIKLHVSLQKIKIERSLEKRNFLNFEHFAKKILIGDDGWDDECLNGENFDLREKYLLVAFAHVIHLENKIEIIEGNISYLKYELLGDIIFNLINQLNGINFFYGIYIGDKKSSIGDLIGKKWAINATDVKYAKQRYLLDDLERKAEELWSSGSNLYHHKMRDFLINEYKDNNGEKPFSELSKDAVLAKVKHVALRMNRPDLILGLKKTGL